MLCSSCGHDNPRENRYCGLCGTPFPHLPLTVPDAQSTLTFNSAPLQIAPSPLPIPVAEPSEAAPTEQVPEVEATQPASEERRPVEAPVVGATPIEPPRIEAKPLEVPPVEFASEQPEEAAPVIETPPLVAAPPSIAEREIERAPIIESAPPPVPEPPAVSPTPAPEPPCPVAPPVESGPHLVRPRRETPTTVAAKPSLVPPDSPRVARVAETRQEPPPASAGMPTFKSVSEASGAPDVSPFEPPEVREHDEARDLQEFVANFRYTPPDEAFDELTMRSEVPIVDAEEPVAVSHPSFDDDEAPPPEAGPHPTGQEYYPPVDPATGRSRYLDIADTRQAAPRPQAKAASGSAFLGLGDSPPPTTQPLGDNARPSLRRWLLWTSLVVLLAIFGGLGFLEGRAQKNHSDQGPIEVARRQFDILRQQYDKLRQRIAASRAAAPSTGTTETQPAEAPKPAEPQATSQAAPATGTTQPNAAQPNQAQPNNSAQANSPAATQQQPQTPPVAQPQSPSTTDQAAAAKQEPSKPIEAPAIVPRSKHEPGQQEWDKAMETDDPTSAAAWLWKSTSRGNPEAPVRLAEMYIKGKGVPRSCEQALVLLRSAANRQNAPARNRLATLYANGTCVVRDRVKAYQLLASALEVDPGSEWAQQSRKDLWNEMTPEERARAEKPR